MKVRPISGLLVLFLVGLIAAIGLGFAGQASAASAQRRVENEAIEKPEPQALVGGTVRFADGSPVAGLIIDFFEANADGNRGTFLGDVETDSSGLFSRSVVAGCYVLTYIAPDGQSFVGGDRYFQIGVCVKAGEKVTDLDARLAPRAHEEASIGGTVRFADGSPVAGLVIDFFETNADGSRGAWLGDETSDVQGSYGRVVEPQCYVLVFIAPEGKSFVGGGQYLEVPICVAAGESSVVDAALISGAAECLIEGRIIETALIQAECDALLTLYNTTDGSNWIDNRGWNTPTDPCTWTRVICEDSSLTRLWLFQNNLRGSLPAELAELTNLQVLFLNGNDLSGPIPPELAQLTDLTDLSLSDNRMTGPIPPELGQLMDLRFLVLSDNDLSGSVPARLGQLRQLFSLDLSRNQLSGAIPPELGGLNGVELMRLSSNQLSGPIPPELGQLSNVRFLELADNQLSGEIPPELQGLRSLRVLLLNSNQLSGSIPQELGQLNVPDDLNLRDNQLTGDITAAIAAFRAQQSLARLRLSDGLGGNNCLTVTDAELASWISARDPDWDECDSGQTDPCDQSVASPLTSGECEILMAFFEATKGPGWTIITGWNTATDPCTWVGITCVGSELTQIWLVQNGLRGSLPAELGDLPDLQVLALDFNNSRGPIPPELGQLTTLRTLDLGPSSFSGPIPPELGNLTSLELLDLGANGLSGSIPAELGGLSNLGVLILSGNPRLSGSIPPELGELSNLGALSLGNTGLSGPIPAELGRLTNLRSLNLAASQFSGSIPPELGQLSNLTSLSLDRNQLTGPIPPELGQLSSLSSLRLDENLLTGDITVAMSALRTSATVRTLALSDGPGGNDCFSVDDSDLATWISTFDLNWAECG